jgi:hypothetical protein
VRLAIVAALAVSLAAGAAHADKADQLFKKGQKLLAEKRYAEACAAFQDSDRLDPAIGAKLNVARCFQAWGKLATARRWYADAEQQATRSKDERAGKIHALLEDLDASVPRLTVKAPPDAILTNLTLKLDGVVLEVEALGSPQRVDPGPHEIEYIVDGTTRTKLVPVDRGGSVEVVLDLPTLVRSRPSAEPLDPATAERAHQRQRLALGIGGGGVLALGVAGVVTLRARSDYHHALSVHCRGDTAMCDDVGQSAAQSARRRANISTGVTAIGVAAVAVGAYMYITASHAASRRGEQALYLVPSVGSDGGGLVVGGAF